MKFITIISALSLSALPSMTFAQNVQTLSYDTTYDSSSGSLDTVACSNGANGLEPQYTTFGSLPSFPNIGGAYTIAGWDSVNCGTCWQLTYTNAKGAQKSLNITAMDVSLSGFNIALAAMNTLTDGQATQLGRVNVDAVQVDLSGCGL